MVRPSILTLACGIPALLLAQPGMAQDSAETLPPGTYASRWEVSRRARLPPGNRWVRVATFNILLHEISADPFGSEDARVAKSRYCWIEQEPLGRTRTILRPDFVAAIPEWESRLEVRGDEAELEEHVIILGAELIDPEGDALPTDGGDPRIVDMDGDGQPGFTVEVEGVIDGEVYMVQRLVPTLRGQLLGGGRMRGNVTVGGEQEVIGASNQILAAFTPRFLPDPDESRSTFVWVPVPDGSTCESVLARTAELFGDDDEG